MSASVRRVAAVAAYIAAAIVLGMLLLSLWGASRNVATPVLAPGTGIPREPKPAGGAPPAERASVPRGTDPHDMVFGITPPPESDRSDRSGPIFPAKERPAKDAR